MAGRRLVVWTAALALLLAGGVPVLAADGAGPVRLVDVSRDEATGSSTWRYEVVCPAGETVRSWTLELEPEILDRIVWSSVDFQRIPAEGLRLVFDRSAIEVEIRLADDEDIVVGEIGARLFADGGTIHTVTAGPVLAGADADGDGDSDAERTIVVWSSRPGS